MERQNTLSTKRKLIIEHTASDGGTPTLVCRGRITMEAASQFRSEIKALAPKHKFLKADSCLIPWLQPSAGQRERTRQGSAEHYPSRGCVRKVSYTMIPQNRIKCLALKTVHTLALAAILGGSAYAQARHGTLESSIHYNSLAISPDGRTAVASCSERPDVIIYDLEAKQVRGLLNHFITPRDIQFDPTGRYFYVSDSSLGVIKKIDADSLKTISVLLASPGPFGTTISNDGRTLYVNNEAASIVTIFDLASGRPIAHINPYSQPRTGTRHSPDKSLLYVIDFWDDAVDIVNTSTEQIAEQISGFSKIRAISVTQDGKTLFAANSGTDTIAVVNLSSRSIIATIPVGRTPHGVALSPDEQFAYVGNLTDNTVSVVALSSFQVIATICGFNEPAQAIAFARDGSNAYVLNSDLSVSIVNLKTNRIVSTILPRSNVETAGISAVEGEIQ